MGKTDKCSFCGGNEVKEVRLSESYTNYGPKPILLKGIPAKKCNDCGAETISVDAANSGVIFLRRVEAGLVNVVEDRGIVIAQFPNS